MKKRAVLSTARKYGIDLKRITIKIQSEESWLATTFCDRADVKQIRRKDLLTNVFGNKEQLILTLFHEKYHVIQSMKHVTKYVQENRELTRNRQQGFGCIGPIK